MACKKLQKAKAWIKQDIRGTYFVYGVIFPGVSSSKPYTVKERKLKKLENLHPHLSLSNIKKKINSESKKLGFKTTIQVVK